MRGLPGASGQLQLQGPLAAAIRTERSAATAIFTPVVAPSDISPVVPPSVIAAA